MKLEFNFKNIWLLSILLILVAFSIYLININKEEGISNLTDKKSYNIVDNYNDFYTVNSCVYRYLTYLQSKKVDSLLKVLDEDFINSNGINESNIFNYLTSYEGNLNFSSKKMYEEKLNSNLTKYYVYGCVEKDVFNSMPEKHDSYFIVILDKEEKIFSIHPYSGEIFK